MDANGGENEITQGKDYKTKIRTGACTLISASRAFFIVFPVMRQAGLKMLAIIKKISPQALDEIGEKEKE